MSIIIDVVRYEDEDEERRSESHHIHVHKEYGNHLLLESDTRQNTDYYCCDKKMEEKEERMKNHQEESRFSSGREVIRYASHTFVDDHQFLKDNDG